MDAIEKRSISSASLPLKEEERGRPDIGAVEVREEEDEDAGTEALGETVDVAIAARY